MKDLLTAHLHGVAADIVDSGPRVKFGASFTVQSVAMNLTIGLQNFS